MTKTEEGLIEMKQTELIYRAIEALDLDSKHAIKKWNLLCIMSTS